MTGIMQAVLGSSFAPPPTVIGQAYGGGFYAGQISTTANGVATHYLIIAPNGKLIIPEESTNFCVNKIRGDAFESNLPVIWKKYGSKKNFNNSYKETSLLLKE